MDVFIFTAIAAFVIYKLHKMLGNEYDFSEKSKKIKDVTGIEKNANVATNGRIKGMIMSTLKNEKKNDTNLVIDANKQLIKNLCPEMNDEMHEKMLNLYQKINGFSYEGFLNGVNFVFENLMESYSSQDTEAINSACVKDVAENFNNLIKTNLENKIVEKVHVAKIQDLKILEIENINNCYIVSIEIKSLQISYTENLENQELISGNKTDQISVHEIWSFTKLINSDDLEWKVQKINIIN